jgi:hypothetical protein
VVQIKRGECLVRLEAIRLAAHRIRQAALDRASLGRWCLLRVEHLSSRQRGKHQREENQGTSYQ